MQKGLIRFMFLVAGVIFIGVARWQFGQVVGGARHASPNIRKAHDLRSLIQKDTGNSRSEGKPNLGEPASAPFPTSTAGYRLFFQPSNGNR